MKTNSSAQLARCVIASVILLTTPPTVLAAKFYKWVDANGSTHYTEKPPEPGVGEVINVDSGASSDKEDAMKRLEQRRTQLQEQVDKKNNPTVDPTAEAEKKNQEIIKSNCEVYRKNLKTMAEHSRIKEKTDTGETRMLPEEERQERMKKAQEYISKNCN